MGCSTQTPIQAVIQIEQEKGRVTSTWARMAGAGQAQVPSTGISMEMCTHSWGHPGYSVLNPLPAQTLQSPMRAWPGPHLPEGLVSRLEPAHIATGGEEQQPDQGQAKVGS